MLSKAPTIAEIDRVLIVDDHPLVRDSLRGTITEAFCPNETYEAHDFQEALASLERQTGFDLVLLDLNLPGVDGLSALRQLRSRFPMLPVVMMSGNFDWNIVKEAIDAGAAGFLPKTMNRDAIVQALQSVLSGEIYLPAQMGVGDRELLILERIEALSPQQKIILAYLVQGFFNKQIAFELQISLTTVKLHISGIFDKLEVVNRTQAVILANQVKFGSQKLRHD